MPSRLRTSMRQGGIGAGSVAEGVQQRDVHLGPPLCAGVQPRRPHGRQRRERHRRGSLGSARGEERRGRARRPVGRGEHERRHQGLAQARRVEGLGQRRHEAARLALQLAHRRGVHVGAGRPAGRVLVQPPLVGGERGAGVVGRRRQRGLLRRPVPLLEPGEGLCTGLQAAAPASSVLRAGRRRRWPPTLGRT